MKIDLNWAEKQTWKTLFNLFNAYSERESKRNNEVKKGREMEKSDWDKAFEDAKKNKYTQEEAREDYLEWLKTLEEGGE